MKTQRLVLALSGINLVLLNGERTPPAGYVQIITRQTSTRPEDD